MSFAYAAKQVGDNLIVVVALAGTSALIVFLWCIYTVPKTFFSIWRKRVVRGASPGVPDGCTCTCWCSAGWCAGPWAGATRPA